MEVFLKSEKYFLLLELLISLMLQSYLQLLDLVFYAIFIRPGMP